MRRQAQTSDVHLHIGGNLEIPGSSLPRRPAMTVGKAADQVATARTGFGSFCCLWLRNSADISVFSTCSSRVRAFATKAASVIR
jgi:hypothetical protein